MLQDTYCSSSHNTSKRITSLKSDALSSLNTNISQMNYYRKLNLLYNIAQFYSFFYLEEILGKFLVNDANLYW